MPYIIIPKKKLLVPAGHCQGGMHGLFRVQILRPDGRVRWDSGFFNNKILTAGRNAMGTQTTWLTNCHLGTGSTAPTTSDTQLEVFVVNSSSVQSNTDSAQASPPYFGWRRKVFRFAVGAGHGGQNLSEVGIGWGSSGATLVSRALIIDPNTGAPTTVTPLSDELVDVTYEIRYYPQLNDVLNTVTLDGVVYDTTTRAALVNGTAWSDRIGNDITYSTTATTVWKAYDGNIGTVIQLPSGNSANLDDAGNVYAVAYSNNSYQRKVGTTCGSSGWNLGAGIRSLVCPTEAGYFQTQFAAQGGGGTIPKTTNQTMQMEWTVSWAALNVTEDWTMIAASDSTTPAAGEWNTNLAGTVLRVAWEDANGNDWQRLLQAENPSVFRITSNANNEVFVEYTVNGSYTEQTNYTDIPVTQTAIRGGGPTATTSCTLRNLVL